MQHLLADPKLLVERDSGIVTVVSLNIDDPGVTSSGNLAQVPDQGGCDILPSMLCADGEIIYVKLTPCLLELVEFIGDEAADDLLACQSPRAITCSFASRSLR
jgi:hypothetical protein